MKLPLLLLLVVLVHATAAAVIDVNNGTAIASNDVTAVDDVAAANDVSAAIDVADANLTQVVEDNENSTDLVNTDVVKKVEVKDLPIVFEANSREGACDTTEALISNCHITVVSSGKTVEITQDTAMANVAINCQTTKESCFKLKTGITLKIANSDITGSGQGRFIDMEADATLMLDKVNGEGFGRTTKLGSNYINGGFIHAAANYKINIKNTELKNNKGYHGGVIFLHNVAGELNILDSEFTTNTANRSGGVIYAVADSSDISKTQWNIKNSIFEKNNATLHYAGAILAQYITATVTNTKFIENECKSHGGAFYIYKASFKFQCSLIANNVNTGTIGGAIYGTTDADITTIKTLIVGNKDKSDDNDIYCDTTTIKTDLYSTTMKAKNSCKYDYIPPSSDQNVDCIPE